jgi:hypothetical protein
MAALSSGVLAAGRGGFGGGGDQGNNGGSSGNSGNSGNFAPAGSGSFRPSAPVAPPPQPTFVQPQNPVIQHAPPPANVIQQLHQQQQQQQQQQQHHTPGFTGNATTLPSANGPFPQHPSNQFNQSRQTGPPTQTLPTQPGGRAAQREDFLGLQGEQPRHRSDGSNRTFTPSASTSVNGVTVLTPSRTLQAPTASVILPNPPGRSPRPIHAPLADHWKSANDHFASQFNHWSLANAANIASFQANRDAHWNLVRQHQTAADWRGQLRTPQYRQWRSTVWDYRRSRAEEIWDRTRNLHENLFDSHWWSTASWRHRPWVITANFSPWWWWNYASWPEECIFFSPDLGPDQIPYDPGTNVFYDGDTYDVNGQDAGNAADARAQAIALANPPVDEIPVPEPTPEGQPPQWLPLGAWALTQEEQGDAVLFFQISVDRNGIVAGGYKNALTGEEQPILGRVDRRRQRIAWHIANNPQTVFETGLSNLDYDVASVFVHFGETQTQTWLLVRLPSPDMPPGQVSVPDGAQ